MMITKIALPRRTFLRGMGVSLALPLLDAMVPALTAATKPIPRMGFSYTGNGQVMHNFKTTGEGSTFQLSKTLSVLEPFKDQVIVPTGTSHLCADAQMDGNGDHSRGATAWLSGAHAFKTEGADVRGGQTIDQTFADQFGQETPLRSLELGTEQQFAVGLCDNGYSCFYENTVSWKTATTPQPPEVNPRVIFERLFGDGGTATQRLARNAEDKSLLDLVTGDISRLQKKLGNTDRRRVTEYLDSVREIERRIQATEAKGEQDLLVPDRPVGIPEAFSDHTTMMYDLMFLAFQADITRVFTMQVNKEESNRAYPEIGVTGGHHSVSHHQLDPVKYEQGTKINMLHIGLWATLVEKLAKTADGDGTLLDHTILMHGAGLSDADQHSHRDLPVVTVGGKAFGLKGGRTVKAPFDTPMANFLLGLLNYVDVHCDKVGDSTGPLVGL